ncbi:MAG TPA: hypothetical protein VFN49_12080 [Candidatus Aquilonibacter sp.]|nr:hypothetical protein [Candidatus Aquilonibacter sp.]
MIAAALLSVLIAQAPTASPAAMAGDAAFARGDFQTAFTDYNDAIIKNPFDGEAVLGLGTLDLYRNDWQNARTYLNRAHHLLPGDERVIARLRVLRQRLPKPGHYAFDLVNARADIPFVTIDPVPVVKATIGMTTLSLVVDTSSGSVELTPAAARSIGVADGGLIPSLSMPNLIVRNVPLTVRNRPFTTGVHVDGAIGTVFLSHFLPTFDYAHNRLILRRWEASPSLDASFVQTGAKIERMWLVGDRLLVASGRIAGSTPALFAVLTGDAAAITVPAPAAFAAPSPDVPFEIGGTLGNGFFRSATLTLDFASMKMIVSR